MSSEKKDLCCICESGKSYRKPGVSVDLYTVCGWCKKHIAYSTCNKCFYQTNFSAGQCFCDGSRYDTKYIFTLEQMRQIVNISKKVRHDTIDKRKFHPCEICSCSVEDKYSYCDKCSREIKLLKICLWCLHSTKDFKQGCLCTNKNTKAIKVTNEELKKRLAHRCSACNGFLSNTYYDVCKQCAEKSTKNVVATIPKETWKKDDSIIPTVEESKDLDYPEFAPLDEPLDLSVPDSYYTSEEFLNRCYLHASKLIFHMIAKAGEPITHSRSSQRQWFNRLQDDLRIGKYVWYRKNFLAKVLENPLKDDSGNCKLPTRAEMIKYTRCILGDNKEVTIIDKLITRKRIVRDAGYIIYKPIQWDDDGDDD
jgi:hypothetical protein